MKWRIEEPNRRWQAVECFENANEILALIRKQFRDCGLACCFCSGENHLPHSVNAVAFEEHVFGSAKTNSLRAEGDCISNLFRRVGICPNAESSKFVRPTHQFGVLAI